MHQTLSRTGYDGGHQAKKEADSDTKAERIALANADRRAVEALQHPPAVSHPSRPAGGSLSRL